MRRKENRVDLGRTGGFGLLKREQRTTVASGTRGTRMSRGYTLDTHHVPSTSKRVFDRGGRHRRNWRQVYGLRRQNPYYLRFFGKMIKI